MKQEFGEAYTTYALARNAFIDACLKAGKSHTQIVAILNYMEFQAELRLPKISLLRSPETTQPDALLP